MAARTRCAVCVVVAACGSPTPPPRPEPLAPLPPPAIVDTDRFADSAKCGQCHLASDSALRDASQRDVSPVRLWRSSMMALAARDPYYLAVFGEERTRDPGADAVCIRCHAPAGTEETPGLGFDALVSATDPGATIGREGVTCTLCHQIASTDLGSERSFSGGFVVDYGRAIFGPHANPFVDPMRMFVDYTPTAGDHVATAALCATCHTVILRPGAGEVVEQATFLEWRSSSVAATKPCQACHVPAEDDDGVRISTPISKFPATLSPRSPVGRHLFVGGNAYMLRLIASAEPWAQTGLAPAELEEAAVAAEAHLATAAKLMVTPGRAASRVTLAVTVANQTGHKLPTGYPSRRMWLHVTVRAADGAIVFESGAATAGVLAGDAASALRPHRDRIDRADQVQVWQAVLVDRDGAPTHRALDAVRYGKDDRIEPAGFAPSAADRARVASVGVDGDPDFVPGSDTVTYAIDGVPAGASAEIELLYQSLTPAIVDAIDDARTPAGTRFVDLARARPITPIVLARFEAALP
jgi:hypothetical protein